MRKSSIRVAGLDLAAVNSGMAIIEARVREGRNAYPPLDWHLHYEKALKVEQLFYKRVHAARDIREQIRLHEVELVVLEDTIKRGGRNNTTGLQQQELLTLVMYHLWEDGLPMLLVNPATMRSFLGVGTAGDKDALVESVRERYGFASKQPRKGERSNVTDAFAHAYIGACSYYAREGKLTANLKKSEKNVIYGGGGKNRLAMIEASIIKREKQQRG